MKICHVITRFIRGGADENTLLTCNAHADMGHEIHLIYGKEYHPGLLEKLHPRVIPHQVGSLVRNIHPFLDAMSLFSVYMILKRIGPDIVHTHTSKAGIIGRGAAWLARVPRIVHGVHIVPFIGVGRIPASLYIHIERIASIVTDAFISVSEGVRAQYVTAGIGAPGKHFVVPSGMDLKQFNNRSSNKGEWRDILSVENNHIHDPPVFVLLVSRLERRKRPLEFINVFFRVARRVPNSYLILAGEGPEKEGIVSAINNHELGDRVFYVGYRDDVSRLMGLADIGIISSVREGLPRVAVQYVASGLPVITTALPGIERIVTDGVNGYVVPIDNLDAMEDLLVELLHNHQMREKMAKNSGERDMSEWSYEKMSEDILSVYHSLFESSVNS